MEDRKRCRRGSRSRSFVSLECSGVEYYTAYGFGWKQKKRYIREMGGGGLGLSG
jgi:hypothetical protein